MKLYHMIGGINGVGKSSFLGVLKGNRSDLGCIIDENTMPADSALMKIRECLQRGLSFTQEITLSGYQTEQTTKQAREAGYYVRLDYIALDTAQESLARIANRVKRGGHDIDREDMLRRFSGRWEAVKKVLPYCDEAAFYDNDNGFVKVAEYRNGELLPIGERRPEWLKELQAYLRGNTVK